jgi:hypothetical protein
MSLVELEQEGVRMITRGSMLMEAQQPMRVMARARAQVILLPHRGALGARHAPPLALCTA